MRVLIGKPGLDGHDRGAKVVAAALRDAGFEVIYTGLHQTVDELAEAALEEDCRIVGLSVLSGAHLSLVRKFMERLRAMELTDVAVVVGGAIPPADVPKLHELGVAAVFPTGTRLDELLDWFRRQL
ncbi:MAG: cobalamin B12-binding domain-containing protein [Gemmatimonadetes bacterium]|nr:cobalamin B12-binding domain-containing protein [Gemmatimonadota bacterium]